MQSVTDREEVDTVTFILRYFLLHFHVVLLIKKHRCIFQIRLIFYFNFFFKSQKNGQFHRIPTVDLRPKHVVSKNSRVQSSYF